MNTYCTNFTFVVKHPETIKSLFQGFKLCSAVYYSSNTFTYSFAGNDAIIASGHIYKPQQARLE